jgi:hypothetical protein
MGRTCIIHGGVEKCVQNFGLRNLNRRDDPEDLSIDGRIILESILKKYDGRVWAGLIWLRIVTIGGLL